MTTLVHRCATCGAPLDSPHGQTLATCIYCGAENRLVSVEVEQAQAKHARFAQAAADARQMAVDLEARGQELMAAFERDQQRAMVDGDRAAAESAIRHFEGYMRLQYAPTLHVYRNWDPDDPQVVAALKQIDDAIDQAVGSVAESLGVEYRSTRERLGIDPS